MVTVYAGWYSSRWQPTRHELQQCHLRRRILHCYSVGLELEIGSAPNRPPILCIRQERFFGVFEVSVEDLFGERQLAGGTKDVSHFVEVFDEFGIRRGSRSNI